MFDRYLPSMKLLHVDWFSKRYQFSSMPDYAAAARMVSPKDIMLALIFLRENTSCALFVMASICKTSCDEVLKKLSKEMGDHTILWWGCPPWYWTMHPQNSPIFLFSSSIRGLVSRFYLFDITECFCIFFDLCLCVSITVSLIVTLPPTIFAGDVVKVYLGFLFILFFFTFIIPGFSTLCEHKLVAETLILVFPIRVIIRLKVWR